MNGVEFAKAFLEKAKEDFASAKILMENGIYANALYFAQQAAEKAAKALLIIFGKFTPEHVISELILEIASQLPEDEEKKLETLSENLFYLEKYWLKPRCPIKKGEDIWNPVKRYSKEETKTALKKAEECIAIVEEFLREIIEE